MLVDLIGRFNEMATVVFNDYQKGVLLCDSIQIRYPNLSEFGRIKLMDTCEELILK